MRVGILAIVVWALAANLACGDELVRQYLSGLRARRLFSVAETYCLSRLGEETLLPAERAELVVELSRTFAEHATYRTGVEQRELWERAQSLLAEQIRDDPHNPLRPLIELQAAVVPAAHAEMLAWQSESAPYDQSLRRDAIAALESALAGLRVVEERQAELSRDYRNPTEQERADGALMPSQVKQLSESAAFHAARISLWLGELQEPGIARTAALHDAQQRLQTLARSRVPSVHTWESRLLLIRVYRTRDEWAQARSQATLLLQSQPPAEIEDRAVAELARLDVLEGRPADAMERLGVQEQQRGRLSDELAAVEVQALLAARAAALNSGDLTLAADLWSAAEAAARGAAGPWRARADGLLEQAMITKRYGGELAAQVQAASAAYARGDVDSALQHYAAAIEDIGDADPSIRRELLSTRGSILLRQGDFDGASRDFAVIATTAETPKQRAEADLLYAYCLGKAWEQRQTQRRREAYTAALTDHLTKFEGQATATEATWMLATFQEQRRQWTQALELYRAIPADHPHGQSARARIAALYELILERLRELGQPTDEWEDRATRELTRFLDTMPLPPERLDVFDAETVLRLARIVLNHRRPNYRDSGALLDRILASEEVARRDAEVQGTPRNSGWDAIRHSALQLRIVSLAGQDRIDEAHAVLDSLEAGGHTALLSVLNGLAEISKGIPADRQRALAELQLRTALRIDEQRGTLEPPAARLLDNCLAQSYAALDRTTDALAVYERILKQSPHSKSVLRAAAELLDDQDDEGMLEAARNYWRRLESMEAAGTPDWMDARWHVADCTLRLGRRDECRKLIAVTKLLYPGFGEPALAERFAELESRL